MTSTDRTCSCQLSAVWLHVISLDLLACAKESSGICDERWWTVQYCYSSVYLTETENKTETWRFRRRSCPPSPLARLTIRNRDRDPASHLGIGRAPFSSKLQIEWLPSPPLRPTWRLYLNFSFCPRLSHCALFQNSSTAHFFLPSLLLFHFFFLLFSTFQHFSSNSSLLSQTFLTFSRYRGR